MSESSYWLTGNFDSAPSLKGDLHVEALVIGGGIAGVTAAYLLKKSGVQVALLEKGRIGCAETGHTTAHITYPTDLRLTKLVERFGRNHAEAVWDAGSAAALQISELVKNEAIDCDYKQVPAYLYATFGSGPDEIAQLRNESQLAQQFHFDATFVRNAPVVNQPALCFANQAKFHPLKYLTGLVSRIRDLGGLVFEKTEVLEFQNSSRRVTGEGFSVSYNKVFIATHVPLQGSRGFLDAALFQTKLVAYSTYALRAKIKVAAPEALYWDTANPYLYFRIDRYPEGYEVIIGGEDHKTGQECHTKQQIHNLGQKLNGIFPHAERRQHWSGQVIETVDGIPYIGETVNGEFIATGFSGTGMTFGTLAGMMFRDHVLSIQNPWTELFSVERKLLSASWDYLCENKDYPYYMVKGIFSGGSDMSSSSLFCDEGKIIKHAGRKTAAYRDPDGKITLLSATCPHMGCVVCWNDAAKTWDCPCHGSRFSPTGEVLAGPAEHPLKPFENDSPDD